MTRIFIIAVLFVCGSPHANAQLWQSVGGGTSMVTGALHGDTANDLLYAVGSFEYAGDTLVHQVAVWDGIIWDNLGSGTGDTNCLYGCSTMRDVLLFDGKLWIGGQHFINGGVWGNKFISYWDGATWVYPGNTNTYPRFANIDNQLFAFGGFDTLAGSVVQRIGTFDGSSWQQFGTQMPEWGIGESVNCAARYQGKYFFGGNFELPGMKSEVLGWDGTNWFDVGGGVKGSSWVDAICVYQGFLFVGGYFFESDGNVADFMMAWDGEKWFDPFPFVQYLSQIRDLEVIDDELHVVGAYQVIGDTGIYGLARYDGSDFCAYGGMNYPQSVKGLNGKIFVTTPKVFNGDTVNYIAEWMGGNATHICVSQPLGVEEAPLSTNNQEFSVYPNPANGHVSFEFKGNAGEVELTLYNAIGQKVLGKQFQTVNGVNVLQIDVAGQPPGLFLLQLKTEAATGVVRLVVE